MRVAQSSKEPFEALVYLEVRWQRGNETVAYPRFERRRVSIGRRFPALVTEQGVSDQDQSSVAWTFFKDYNSTVSGPE